MSAGGAVYDRGYRPYDGPLGGRRAATAALYRTSLRRAIGLRRPWRQKVAPFVLLAIAVLPAAINVGIGYLTRDSPSQDFSFITYREYVGVSSALLLFVALVAPDLVCPDRRQRVLPLIFARPVTGTDYALAKVGAIFTCVFAFSFLPQVVLYIGQMLVSKGALDYLRANTAVLWQVPLAVAVLALFYSLLSVAVASLSGRRVVAGATLLGITLVSSTVAAILVDANRVRGGRGDGSPAALLNILALPLYVRDLVFLGHLSPSSPLAGVAGGGVLAVLCYLAVLAGCVAILLVRYRTAEL
jgi:ABC-type transport system involved in multi-copper enzyme maturation permease subunit